MNLPNRSYCEKKHCVYRRKTATFNDDTPITLYNAKKFWFGLQCLTTTFNNISVILWQSALLVEETRVPWENNRPAASDSMSPTDKLYHIMLYTKLRSIKISIYIFIDLMKIVECHTFVILIQKNERRFSPKISPGIYTNGNEDHFYLLTEIK